MATPSQKQVTRTANGQFRPGVSGNLSGNVHRSRHALNADTIREMHEAFRKGGRQAIDKVMRNDERVTCHLSELDQRDRRAGAPAGRKHEQKRCEVRT
jgi:hypothetical protein